MMKRVLLPMLAALALSSTAHAALKRSTGNSLQSTGNGRTDVVHRPVRWAHMGFFCH